MFIEEISLEGFKSYAQRTIISNFDPKFNAITGLNGSGKSNVLDAICFVLGITNLQQVRAGTLQELVYKQGQAGITKATVSILFNNEDRRSSPVGYEDQKQITVTRQIVIGGRNKYLINGHVAQPSRVQNLFHSVQLNVNNPHFLIMQGRITKVLNMKPAETLSMLEEAAGTRMYEVKKESAVKTLQKKQAKVEEINSMLADEILPALERLRREKAQYQQWVQANADLEKLRRFCLAFQFLAAERAKTEAQGEVARFEHRISELVQRGEGYEREMGEKKGAVKRMVEEREREMGDTMKKLSEGADELSKELVKVTTAYKNQKEMVEGAKKERNKLRKNCDDMEREVEKRAAVVAGSDEKMQKLQKALEEQQAALEAAEEELSAVQAGKSGQSGDSKSLVEKLAEAKAAAAGSATEAKQLQLRAEHLAKELGPKSKALAGKQKAMSSMRQKLQALEGEVAACENKVRNLGFDEQYALDMECSRGQLEAGVRRLSDEIAKTVAELNVGFSFRDPSPGFDHSRVKGVVARLFGMRDPAAATALEVVAGGKLYNVVVDTEQTGKQLLTHGGLKRRVTIIPLNKIEARTIPAAVQARAARLVGEENVTPALSLIDCDQYLQPAMAFVFGGHFVCRDSETARKVAFNPDILTPCVTLEGDSYSPGGVLTGGSRRTGGLLLSGLHKARDSEEALKMHSAELERVAAELSGLKEAHAEHQRLSSELQLKRHQLGLLREQMAQTEEHQLSVEVATIEADLTTTRERHAAALEDEKRLAAAVADLERQVETHGREKGRRVKELEGRVREAKRAAAEAGNAVKAKQDEAQRMALDLEGMRAELAGMREQVAAAEEEMEGHEGQLRVLEKQVAARQEALKKVEAELKDKRDRMKSSDAELAALERTIAELAEKKTSGEMEVKRLNHQIKDKKAGSEAGAKTVERMKQKHPWISSERQFFGRPGSDYDFEARDPIRAQEELAEMQTQQSSLEKRVNKAVMAHFDRAQQEYQDLEGKKSIILRDKAKIEEAIEQLDEKKKAALRVTWEKVTRDFGSIFSTLLPGTSAKLEPPEGQDFLDGLEVKVAFGDVWKQSLSELSGGQRSLLALSLILALLLFKPAPLYILDEVDAALDLSHTQNIGRMIKSHFPQSQFVVVSLKEGMFNNANVIFRTKFVDGVSTVTRTVPAIRDRGDGNIDEERGKTTGKQRGANRVARDVGDSENVVPMET